MERVLRRYSRISEKTRECVQCGGHINPGDYYDGFVIAVGKGVLRTDTSHLDPACHNGDFDDDLEDEQEVSSEDRLAA